MLSACRRSLEVLSCGWSPGGGGVPRMRHLRWEACGLCDGIIGLLMCMGALIHASMHACARTHAFTFPASIHIFWCSRSLLWMSRWLTRADMAGYFGVLVWFVSFSTHAILFRLLSVSPPFFFLKSFSSILLLPFLSATFSFSSCKRWDPQKWHPVFVPGSDTAASHLPTLLTFLHTHTNTNYRHSHVSRFPNWTGLSLCLSLDWKQDQTSIGRITFLHVVLNFELMKSAGRLARDLVLRCWYCTCALWWQFSQAAPPHFKEHVFSPCIPL